MKGLQLAALGLIIWKLLSKVPLAGLEEKRAFIASIWYRAKAEVARVGWDPKMVLAVVSQAALESGWGKSGLAVKDNNLFGMKTGRAWLREGKPYSEWPTKEHLKNPQTGKMEIVTVQAKFRKYASWGDSVADNINLLTSLSRYKPVVEAAKRGDVLGYFDALKSSGYATHQSYPGLLAETRGIVEEALA